jgi:hypothetical protein
MVSALSVVGAILTFTNITAGDSRVEALTVFFLTLWFFTIAPLVVYLFCSALIFLFDYFFGLYNRFSVFFIVVATVASAFRSAHFASWKTLAIHFETFSFFTCTTSLFLFNVSGRWNGRMVYFLDIKLNWILIIEGKWVFLGFGCILLSEISWWVRWKIFVSFDEEKRIVQVRDRRI